MACQGDGVEGSADVRSAVFGQRGCHDAGQRVCREDVADYRHVGRCDTDGREGSVVGEYEWILGTELRELMEQRCRMQIVRRWICKMRDGEAQR